MPKTVDLEPLGPIGLIDLTLARRYLSDVQRAIASLNYSDLWRQLGVLIKCGSVRIDTQRARRGRGISLQIHVDGQGNPACTDTVADITIDDELRKYSDDRQMKKRLAKLVKKAFRRSLDTGWEFQVHDADD